MKRLLKKIFNTNTGYFLKPVPYFYDGEWHMGYILCKGYIMFGLSGYDVISHYINKETAERELAILNAQE